MNALFRLGRPLLFRLDAERAHELTVRGLRTFPRLAGAALGCVPDSPVELLGLKFRNPVGVAAGLDKNAECIDALERIGFGYVEVGTITPEPQAGNPRPRVFRLPEHEAVINRLGFNSQGLDVVCKRLERSRHRGILGINIGKNASTPNAQAVDDYRRGLERVFPLADYVTINISSPNTQGLRDLPAAAPVRRLVGELVDLREQLAARHQRRAPLALKLAPDLDDGQLDAAAQALNGSGIDAVIATNTTISRPQLAGHPLANEAGGLSGRPLGPLALATFSGLRERLDSQIPMIGVGGIVDQHSAAQRYQAGAQLLQVYTGFVYRGPQVLADAVAAHRSLSRL